MVVILKAPNFDLGRFTEGRSVFLIRGALSGIYVQTIIEGMKVSCVSDGSLFVKRKGSHTAGLYEGIDGWGWS